MFRAWFEAPDDKVKVLTIYSFYQMGVETPHYNII